MSRHNIVSYPDTDSFSIALFHYFYCKGIKTFFQRIGVHISNKTLRNLIYVYQISSYAEIAFILSRFLTRKQIDVKYFSKMFDINIPILIKEALGEATKF